MGPSSLSKKTALMAGSALVLLLVAVHVWEYLALSRYLLPSVVALDLDAPALVELAAVCGFVALCWAAASPAKASGESVEHLRSFITAAPLTMAMFDTEMRYLAASPRWYSDHQLNPQSVVGKSHYEIFPEIPQRWKDVHQRCLKGATERKDEDLFVRENGTSLWVKWEARPWRRPDSAAVGGIMIFVEDITARKEAELRERESLVNSEVERIRREDAERASIAKDAFLAELSHEIRTPLQAILGWIRIVRLKVREFSLEGLLDASIASATPFALERSVSLEREYSCGNLLIRGDSARLEQCLWNLINNAIKFSQAGTTVVLTAKADGTWVEVSVLDAGHGMTSEGIARAFEPLFQEGSGFSPQHAGLGLGLSIVRGLVELHGGSVRAESEGLGCGSTFTMRLPLEA